MSKIPVEQRSDFKVDNTYWRSLEQLAGTPAFRAQVEREFQELSDPVSRRSFMKVMGASAALAGMVACRRPLEKILPYTAQPEDLIPGTAQHYATVIDIAGEAVGALVEAHEGRPTKVEGNSQHSASKGATDAYMQATILGLYDPDRLGAVTKKGQEAASWADWDKFATAQFSAAREKKGAGVAFLSQQTRSPTALRLFAEVKKMLPEAKFYTWQPINNDAQMQGTKLAFGKPASAKFDFAQPEVIVALDADFLGNEGGSIRAAREFATRRVPEGKMNRLYAVEGNYSVTGGAADHRLRVKPSQVHLFARALTAELVKQGVALPAGVPAAFAENAADAGKASWDSKKPFIEALAKDLIANKGAALIVAGSLQSAEVHAIAAVLNAALESKAVSYREVEDTAAQAEQIKALAVAIEKKEVQTLVMLGGNPAFDAPATLKFGERIATVPVSVHLSAYADETGAKSTWILPQAHVFETWGDARSSDGTCAIQQPIILPLFGGRSEIELLAQIAGLQSQKGYELTRETFKTIGGADDKAWRLALHAGVVTGSEWKEFGSKDFNATVATATKAKTAAGFDVQFVASPAVFDGRFANNAWLQELPDPMTKLVWDNAAIISPATADKLGLKSQDLAKISTRAGQLEAVVWIQPGTSDETVVIALGYGRKVEWSVATGAGFDAYALRSADALGFESGAQFVKTSGTYPLANVQDHHFMASPKVGPIEAKSRPVVREATLEHFKKHPHFAEEMVAHPPLVSLFTEHAYKKHAWAMSIDLNACTGCNVCSIACTAENNVAVVGKDQVRRGREMHWIRLDRYFANTEINTGGKVDTANPRVVHQPMACQHCENAPCEQVCPVTATVHGPEGTNDMQYSRCIGTKYCANNCPYKVRRFNYFNFHEADPEIRQMAFNPDVTVRMRGVMEKCTYCIQRVNRVKLDAKIHHNPLKDGDITPACAQACPSNAIVFGDMNDKTSRVAKARKNSRRYDVLAELNVKPRTTYLARVRNPNPVIG